jgi:arginine transport system substrate-binding protein
MDFESSKYWIATNPDTYKLIGGKIPVGEGYAIMINPEQTQVKTTIDRIILEMEEDGTFLRLYKQYF